MQATVVRDASARVIVVLMAAGRSRATIKRHGAEFNAFAGFLEARGQGGPDRGGLPRFHRRAVRVQAIYARADPETKRKAIENAYQSLTPEPLPNWTADRELLQWLDQICR